MRVALDATPLLGQRTGIGHYVAQLASALAGLPDAPELTLTAFTWRGQRELVALAGGGALEPESGARGPGGALGPGGARALGAGVPTVRSRRVPARLLRAAWSRWDVPPVEWLSGPADIFHGTNFVLPPTRRAAGVVTVHDVAFLRHASTVEDASGAYRELVPRALARAAAVVTPSAAAAADLLDAYELDPAKVVVTPLGVDPSWAATEAPEPDWLAARGLPARYLLFVGTREPRKNLPVLLAAHRQLSADDPSTPPLVLAGPAGWGDGADCVDDGMGSGAGAAGRVIRTGYLAGDELRSIVAGAAALILPSRYEGFGLPALEALACGTPVVVSDIPVLREVTGTHARHVPVGDAEALTAALAATLADEAAADGDPGSPAQARLARRAWAARWTWERCASETMRAYRMALASR